MENSRKRVMRALHGLGQATRPQLAAATGLSCVSIGKLVDGLVRAGEMVESGKAVSEGGRPATLYRYRAEGSQLGYFRIKEEGSLLRARLEMLDATGHILQREEATLAYLEPQIVEGWLDKASPRRRLVGLTLEAHAAIPPGLVERLHKRYGCPVRLVRVSDALADKKEETATLVFQRGREPQCSLYRQGRLQPTGPLGLLPLPGTWAALDYGDHTLVEEMAARLILILSCTLKPNRMVLYADFWSQKLVNRIRFNAGTKLGRNLPALQFRIMTEEHIDRALYRLARSIPDYTV